MSKLFSRRHDLMVEHVARQLQRRFYDDVRARTAGFRLPARVYNDNSGEEIVPDVTMVAKGTQLNVLEVETKDSLNHDQVEHKWQVLSQHASQNGGLFWVVVPKELGETAVAKVKQLNLGAKVWALEEEEV